MALLKIFLSKLSKPSLTFFIGILLAVVVTQVMAHGGDTSLIHSCVKNSNGSITIIDPNGNCSNSETPLDWPATKSQSTAYYASFDEFRDNNGQPHFIDASVPTSIISLIRVPTGHYIITASIDAYTPPTSCSLSLSSFGDNPTSTWWDTADSKTTTFQEPVTLSQQEDINLYCWNSGSNIQVDKVSLNALKVDNLVNAQ